MPATRCEKFAHSLVAAGTDLDRTNQGLLMRLMGLPDDGRLAPGQLSPRKEKAQTLNALVQRLRQLANRQPVLFLVEDGHRIDPTSEELIGLVVEQLKDSTVLLCSGLPSRLRAALGQSDPPDAAHHASTGTAPLYRVGRSDD